MVNHIRLQVTKSTSIQQKIHCSEHGHYLALDRLETFAKKTPDRITACKGGQCEHEFTNRYLK